MWMPWHKLCLTLRRHKQDKPKSFSPTSGPLIHAAATATRMIYSILVVVCMYKLYMNSICMYYLVDICHRVNLSHKYTRSVGVVWKGWDVPPWSAQRIVRPATGESQIVGPGCQLKMWTRLTCTLNSVKELHMPLPTKGKFCKWCWKTLEKSNAASTTIQGSNMEAQPTQCKQMANQPWSKKDQQRLNL